MWIRIFKEKEEVNSVSLGIVSFDKQRNITSSLLGYINSLDGFQKLFYST